MNQKSCIEHVKTYHSNPAGKISVVAKQIRNREDLGVAYTPGVAKICTLVRDDQELAYKYTNICNRVLVVSDGTATLGLGNTGHLASKPVMEGKVVLMSSLAGIDAVDLVCASEGLVDAAKAVACNFGAINLEDVAAPRCFEVERELSNALDIAVFHDDQYGTAVVVAAALKKALRIVDKDLKQVKIVIAGAGASAQATAKLLIHLGVDPRKIWMFDSRGLLTEDRDLDQYKRCFAQKYRGNLTYKEALSGADVFVGLSTANVLTPDDISDMNPNPIVFALANPVPEIDTITAKKLRPDGLFATGSSDDPNQVNNVLCFPFLLRGVLDSQATCVTMNMLEACVEALVSIKCNHMLPDLFQNWELLFTISSAVVVTATQDGIARNLIEDVEKYKWQLLFNRLGIYDVQLPQVDFPKTLPEVNDVDECDAIAIVEYSRYGENRCYCNRKVNCELFENAVCCDDDSIAQLTATLRKNGMEYTKYVQTAGKWRVVEGSYCGRLFGQFKVS